MREIVIERRIYDFKAYVKGEPWLHATGGTKHEALGNLMLLNQRALGMKVRHTLKLRVGQTEHLTDRAQGVTLCAGSLKPLQHEGAAQPQPLAPPSGHKASGETATPPTSAPGREPFRLDASSNRAALFVLPQRGARYVSEGSAAKHARATPLRQEPIQHLLLAGIRAIRSRVASCAALSFRPHFFSGNASLPASSLHGASSCLSRTTPRMISVLPCKALLLRAALGSIAARCLEKAAGQVAPPTPRA